MQKEKQAERTWYFDALRVIACSIVVLLHQSAQKFGDDVGSHNWMTFNFYDSLSRWAVPVFVMISGALFLDPARSFVPRVHLRRYLPRIVLSFVFWSAVYALWNYSMDMRLRDVVAGFFSGSVHLWFLYMIGGLYLLVPLLKKRS